MAKRSSTYKAKQKIWRREHYQRNKAYFLARNDARRRDKAAWIREYKESRGCTDCKLYYPYYVLDFDHLDPNQKVACVGNLTTYGWSKIKAEVVKCDVVCANCHRKRTFARSSNGKDPTL